MHKNETNYKHKLSSGASIDEIARQSGKSALRTELSGMMNNNKLQESVHPAAVIQNSW